MSFLRKYSIYWIVHGPGSVLLGVWRKPGLKSGRSGEITKQSIPINPPPRDSEVHLNPVIRPRRVPSYFPTSPPRPQTPEGLRRRASRENWKDWDKTYYRTVGPYLFIGCIISSPDGGTLCQASNCVLWAGDRTGEISRRRETTVGKPA